LGDKDVVRAYIDEILQDSQEETKALVLEKVSNMDDVLFRNLKTVILQTTDMFWVEHLEVMDYMRSSVNLRAYGQRDPLVEYKREGLTLFKNMERSIGEEILKLIPQIKEEKTFYKETIKLTEARDEGSVAPSVNTPTPIVDGEKVGRNDPCPCGSGKKYKACGLINSEEHHKNISK
jgi:preprotein translocase subunit SecA